MVVLCLIKHHAMKTYGGVELYPLILHSALDGGNWSTYTICPVYPAPRGKERPVPVGCEAVCTPKSVWGEETISAFAGNQAQIVRPSMTQSGHWPSHAFEFQTWAWVIFFTTLTMCNLFTLSANPLGSGGLHIIPSKVLECLNSNIRSIIRFFKLSFIYKIILM
jgi:hypothetical protein